ncbi:hypothetical protein CcCBS67573_g05873 [Chytriomyces confervae]|uniref:Uncharacterized protein n=1 Tax=Chytriomyces confervae TaxID=246404 RepID=A0A507F836_9FUNG|nr:hypothetical protein CcCBS67573_g05873 [Chytriomyces confervae]
MLMGLGFMVNRVAKPDHAFAIPMVQVALKARIHGTSYESCAGIFFSDPSKSARNKGLYQPFMDAVRFFSGLSQAVQHGTVHSPDTVGWGTTAGLVNFGANLVKTMLLEPVRKEGLLQLRASAAHPGTILEKKRDVWQRNKISKVNTIELSIKDVCMTSLSGFSVHAKGERLLYCDTVIQMIRQQYPDRELVLSYDVICKEVAHLQQPYMLQTNIKTPYIAALPVMHAQAHSKECQVKYSPRIIAGLGTILDGEGVEQENSRLAKSIGLTVGETEGNRELDISLIAEDYNCSKLRSALKIISRKLDLAYVDLASIEGAIGQPSDSNRGSYRGFIDQNNTWRANLMKDHCIRKSGMTSVEEEMYLLREQADERGRTIARTRKILNTHVGTNVASKLRRHLKSQCNQLNAILDKLNSLSNTSSMI